MSFENRELKIIEKLACRVLTFLASDVSAQPMMALLEMTLLVVLYEHGRPFRPRLTVEQFHIHSKVQWPRC